MSEHIQPLLERIRSEGLDQAQAERERILSEAREQADNIRQDAQSEAERITAEAEKEANATRERGERALEQAARDLLLRLRTEIARHVQAAAEKAASAPLSSEEAMPAYLTALAEAHKQDGAITVETNPELAKALEPMLPALLKDAGAEGGEVVMNPKSGAGFSLRFGETAEGVSFTDDAVAEWLAATLRPELAALLTSDSSGD